MLELVFTICMVTNPYECETHSLSASGISETACITQGLPEVVKEVRPGWRLVRFACRREASTNA